MKTFSKYILILGSLAFCNSVQSQKVSNKGQEFWVGYGHHQFMETKTPGVENTQNMVLYLSAESQPATVTVTLDSSGFAPALWYKKTYNIPANTVIATENMPKGTLESTNSGSNPNYDSRLYTDPPPFGTGGEGIFRKKGIHIQSNVDIVAYAHIYGSVSSGATVLLPVNSWGYKYTSINSRQVDAAGPGYSWIFIVAKEDFTRIKVTPSVNTRLNKPAGTPFNIDLQKGQIYQIIGQSDNGGNGNEFTGTKIESILGADGNCHAVAAFSGSSRTRGEDVPCGTSSGRDNDMQQMFPEQTWGKKYAVAPFSTASGSTSNPSLDASTFMTCVYKIVVQNPTTIVKKNGVVLTGLINNSYYKYASNTADLIEADKPISVAQFMSGSTICNPGDFGDPEMVFIPPIEQAIKQVFFYRNTKQSIYANYVTIIVPTAGLASLKVDNSIIFNYQYPHPNLPGYTVVVKGWKAAQAQAKIVCDSGFNAITYGLGGAESYAYIAGAYLENLNAISGLTNNPGVDTTKKLNPFNCVNTPVKLSVLYRLNPGTPPPIKVLINMSSLGSLVSPNANVLLNPASSFLVDTVTIKGLSYYQYDLPGTYLFNTANTYYIPIVVTNTATGLCTDDEKLLIEVVVKPKVSADFTAILPTCPTDTVKFIGNATSNGLTIKKWAWEFPAGSPFNDSTQNVKYVFSGQGAYSIKLTSFTDDACSADTTKIINLPLGPTVNFTVNPTSLCEGGAVTITPGTTTGTQWFWDYGDGIKDTLTNGNPFAHTYTSYGSYSLSYSLNDGTSCKPSSVAQIINVRANPFALFTFPNGCLPANGVVQFSSSAFTPDGQPVNIHAWNFGDPGSGVNNTSTLSSPTHSYAVGTYTITYHAETANGCFKDTTVTTTFNVTPSVQFNPLASVCSNVSPFSIANATVTNGVLGTGVYTGPGTSSVGLFDPLIAGVGTHTIWFHFTSTTGNCVDSQSQQITVKDVPKVGFTFPIGCLANSNIQFTDTSKVALGFTPTYSWSFGEPSSGGNNISGIQNPSHNYASDGNYIVKLLVTSNGCSDSASSNVPVSVKPILSYPALAGVCSSLTPFSIASATVTNGVAGIGTYKGPGITNSNGTFNPSVSGIGTHTIWFVFISNMGCTDSTSSTISVGSGPIPGFTYPLTCLPNGNFQFIDTSKIPVGPAPVYQWTFDEPSSGVNNFSSIKNPLHVYSSAGTYNVKLVISLSGCTDSTIVSVPVKIKPILNFPILLPVCANVPAYSIANGTVTNSVLGIGTYSGIGTSSSGTFTPSIAGVGTHIITYIFTSTLGCIDSIQRNIIVNPVPDAGFTFPTNCLANGTVQFIDTSKIGAGVPSYSWDFGEVGSGANNFSNLKNPQHTYSGSSPFNVKQVVSVNGCSDSTTVPVTVKVQPVLNYPILTDVCSNVAPFSVATATVSNGVLGSGLYFGNGITNNTLGTFNPLIAGVGTHIITYIFTSTLGCIDSVKKSILVKAIPDAGFTFPINCLANGTVQFTDTSKTGVGSPTFSWNFGEPGSGANNIASIKNPQHTYSSSGPFNVKQVVSLNGCSDSTTVPVTVRIQPLLNYPVLADICANVAPISIATATVSNSVLGSGLYFGNGITNNSLGTFNPSSAGVGTHIITYIFTSTLGCIDSVKKSILVKAIPDAGFTFPINCLANGTVQFTDTSKTGVGVPAFSWNFGEPGSGANNFSGTKNPQHTYSSSGPFNVKQVVSLNGCSDSTTVPVTVKVEPVLNYPALADVCANGLPLSVATATVTNGVTGSGKYFGNGITDNILGAFNPSKAGVGTHIITYVFTSTLGCIDSIKKSIIVKAVPTASFTYPTGCLPNGLVLFTNSSTGSLGGSYVWNFGDPSSGGNNSSTATNPQHSYNTFGAYTIKLSATLNGCTDDTTITTTFALQPQLAFPALPASICQNATTISIATAFVLNGVAGTGTYSGVGTDNAGNFNPAIAGLGSQQITYSFKSTLGNCVNTINRTIIINPKPVPGIDLTDSICANKVVVIKSNSTVTSGSIVKWEWNIAGLDTVINNALPFNYLFIDNGNFDITLRVTSDSGCISSDTLRTLHIGPIPLASFSAPNEICMPRGAIQFTNSSNILYNSRLKYQWNFGDGTSIDTSSNPIHIYNTLADTAFVNLLVTSNFGCVDDTTFAILFRRKPYVNFLPQSDTLCQGQQVIFYALSNPPVGSEISNYTWDFGDGGAVSNDTNAIKKFTIPGDYLVKLTVQTNNGCIGDSSQLIRVNLQPIIDAGPSFYAHLGEFVNFNPIVNSSSLKFEWSPSTGLNSNTIIRPVLKTVVDQTYYLTATGIGGCKAVDSLKVNLLNPINVPNAFSPNGDGINDRWELKNLANYPNSGVEVFNRYGQTVYKASGNVKFWDGTKGGSPLPIGTYYYVIDLKDGTKPITGYVAILK